MRSCLHCPGQLTEHDLDRETTASMESERREAGLQGVRFTHFTCHLCGRPDIFVELFQLADEPLEKFQERQHELQTTIEGLHSEDVFLAVMRGARAPLE